MTASQSVIARRYLDPASSIGEVLFGLIMTLTFTLGAGIIIEDEGRDGARELLIAALGCNVAWGIIDAVLYVVGQLFDRGRRQRLLHAVRAAADERSATTIVADELDDLLEHASSVTQREALYARIAADLRSSAAPATVSITKADLRGAWASFWLVVLTCVPAAIPFLLLDDARFALRLSNGILLALLFVTGYWGGRYTLGRPWLMGLGLLLVGFVLVGVAIALGG